MPFKSVGWKPWVNDDADTIITAMRDKRMVKKIVVIDDWQYIMANEFMRRSNERGYDKFTDIAKHAWEILRNATALAEDVRVYFLAHSDTDEQGKTRSKTIGKLLNEKITVEGLLTIVLRAQVVNGQHIFSTRTNGNDTVKTPIGMFDMEHVENDLALVDKAICDYYGINSKPMKEAA